jgi:predicted ATPase/transcriptional regulator with XRE-family HTH domain
MPDSFGGLLRRYRIAASLTQEALAERCRLSPAAIAALEQGRRRAPRLSTVQAIVGALDLGAEEQERLARAATADPTEPEFSVMERASVDLDRMSRRGEHWELPAPISPLVGNRAAVGDVVRWIGDDRLVTLLGPGGVGKTRLAIAVAEQTKSAFAGGACWIDLGGVTNEDGVPSAAVRSLGGSDHPAVAIHDQLGELLPQEPALVVVDNCEHVLDAAADTIAALLSHPQVTVLATSRQPLAIPGETTFTVPPLATPDAHPPTTLESMGKTDSVQLFLERSSRARGRDGLTSADAEAIGRICRKLEGIPLAIELTAARMVGLSATQLAEDLERAMALTAATARGVPERQSTLWASIDWSYRLLTVAEQAGFRCLAVFVGPFTAAAFMGVAATASLAPCSQEVLTALATKSLVSLEPDGTYRALDSIRAYAAEQAARAGELTVIRDAHAEYFAGWLVQLGTWEADDTVLDQMDGQYSNFRAALLWSIETGSARALLLVAAFGVGWHQLGRFHDALTLAEEALGVAREEDRPAWARAAAAVAMSRLLARDITFMTEALPDAARVARENGDTLAEGWCNLVLGSCPPFEPVHLTDAYLLASAAPSQMLAALAAASLAFGGTETRNDEWLVRAHDHAEAISNASLWSTHDLAQVDDWTERGRLDEALELAMSIAVNPVVMPGLRLVAIGHVLEVAFLRCDLELAELSMGMRNELGRIWPVGGWRFAEVNDLRIDWLQGQRPPLTDTSSLHWTTRMGITPATMRSVCRAAIDRGDSVDLTVVTKTSVPPSPGSLLAASLSAVSGARALAAGDDEQARYHWTMGLQAGFASGYLLLTCDAVEALGCLASHQGGKPEAATLLASAQSYRDQIGYRFRFRFEQHALDHAWKAVAPDEQADSRPLHEAAELALSLPPRGPM